MCGPNWEIGLLISGARLKTFQFNILNLQSSSLRLQRQFKAALEIISSSFVLVSVLNK